MIIIDKLIISIREKLIEDSTLDRDLLDTKIMGFLTPRPSEVIAKFNVLKKESPEKATDWYYSFSKASDYIRTYRIKKDLKWKAETVYGDLDITINLSSLYVHTLPLYFLSQKCFWCQPSLDDRLR